MREIKKLSELKEIELDIMKKVHLFCVRNNIKYFLSHGTLIGAIRHNGFIPWDDDIDLFMPREDYKRFCNLFPDYSKDMGLMLVNHKTDIYFGRAMSKVIDLRTILTEPEYIGDDPLGVFIDIWPLDGVPENKKELKKHIRVCRKRQRDVYVNITKPEYIIGKRNKLIWLFIKDKPHKELVDKLDKEIQKYSYDKNQQVCCYVDPYKKIMEKKWFDNVLLWKFADTEFFVPCGYADVLSAQYGDYMQYPPIEKRVPHHITNIFWKE